MKSHLSRRALLAVLFTAAGCSPQGGQPESATPVVVTTTTMVTDLVRSIAGSELTVQPLMGPGVDPHSYSAGLRDQQTLNNPKAAVCYSGLHLEGKLTDSMESIARKGRSVIAVADGIPAARLLQSEGEPDPHIWGDAELWAAAAEHTGEKLAAAFPAHAAVFRERAAAAAARLRETHERLKAAAAELPAEKRVLVTSHDAFRYFGRAYGFEVVSVQGISTVSEASLADMARISTLISQRGVKAIFVETSVSPATIERLSKDTGARIGGELFSDALAAPGTLYPIGERQVDTGTVSGMLEANMHKILSALR